MIMPRHSAREARNSFPVTRINSRKELLSWLPSAFPRHPIPAHLFWIYHFCPHLPATVAAVLVLLRPQIKRTENFDDAPFRRACFAASIVQVSGTEAAGRASVNFLTRRLSSDSVTVFIYAFSQKRSPALARMAG